jgi:Xaa-Pro aminopeptidase
LARVRVSTSRKNRIIHAQVESGASWQWWASYSEQSPLASSQTNAAGIAENLLPEVQLYWPGSAMVTLFDAIYVTNNGAEFLQGDK